MTPIPLQAQVEAVESAIADAAEWEPKSWLDALRAAAATLRNIKPCNHSWMGDSLHPFTCVCCGATQDQPSSTPAKDASVLGERA
jgi:hypothetical protein